MISWAYRDDVKIKNEIRKVKPVKAGKVLYFIFDICDEFDDLYFNYALSVEPRLALTFTYPFVCAVPSLEALPHFISYKLKRSVLQKK